MKPRFEEHDNQLFRMLEEPDAINEFSKTPCVIACKYGDLKKYYILDFPLSNPSMSMLAEGFEIIGYPVAEGSRWWALYHAINGEIVTMDDCGIYKIQDGKLWECFPNDSNEWRVVADDGYGYWLEYIHDNTGWQIYKEPEPKPLLADAKVGDLVKRRDGHWAQIVETSGGVEFQPIEYHHNKRLIAVTINGSYTVYNDYMQDDIVEHQPLAPEGSDEWAWQMAKLGIETKCIYGKIRISDSGMIEVCYNGMAYAMPLTQSAENRKYVINKIRECSPDGWQIYEPEPEPAKEQFEVGDWVEYRLHGDTYYGKICNIRGYVYYLSVTTEEIPKDQARAIMLESIIRKLSPREVVIHIGCLSGTIRYCLSFGSDGAKHDAIRIFNSNGKSIAVIHLEALDTETRELVESLLEAMRGEK